MGRNSQRPVKIIFYLKILLKKLKLREFEEFFEQTVLLFAECFCKNYIRKNMIKYIFTYPNVVMKCQHGIL